MGNSLDTDGRGPSERQLLGAGIAVLVVIALATGGLLAKSTGALNSYIRVVADLMNVGDGLPAQSDVKYHGLLVGSVPGHPGLGDRPGGAVERLRGVVHSAGRLPARRRRRVDDPRRHAHRREQ